MDQELEETLQNPIYYTYIKKNDSNDLHEEWESKPYRTLEIQDAD